MKTTYNILLLLLIITVQSCTPQKRLNRLIANNPELSQARLIEKTVPVYHKDTITIPERIIDTVHFTINTKDTIVKIQRNGVNLQLEKKLNHYILHGYIKSDTIYRNDTAYFTYIDTTHIFNILPISAKEKWQYRGQGITGTIIALIVFMAIGAGIKTYTDGAFGKIKKLLT
jgi:hypothetical protein